MCECETGYYDAGVALCEGCFVDCVTCDGPNATQCLSCNGSLNRVLSSGECVCDTGYYLASGNCAYCGVGCLSCSESGGTITCSNCDTANNWSLSSGTCTCASGYSQSNTTCIADQIVCGDGVIASS